MEISKDIKQFDEIFNNIEIDENCKITDDSFTMITLEYFAEDRLDPPYFQKDLEELIQDFYTYTIIQKNNINLATESLNKMLETNKKLDDECDELSIDNTRLIELTNNLYDENNKLAQQNVDDINDNKPYVINLDKSFLYGYIILGGMFLLEYLNIYNFIVSNLLMIPIYYFNFITALMYMTSLGFIDIFYIYIINIVGQYYLYRILKQNGTLTIKIG